SLIVAGLPAGNFVSTSGATPGPGAIRRSGVVRVRPDGASSDFAWLASTGDPTKDLNLTASLQGLAVLPDSSIVVAMQASAGLVTTSDAIAQQGPGYLVQ